MMPGKLPTCPFRLGLLASVLALTIPLSEAVAQWNARLSDSGDSVANSAPDGTGAMSQPAEPFLRLTDLGGAPTDASDATRVAEDSTGIATNPPQIGSVMAMEPAAGREVKGRELPEDIPAGPAKLAMAGCPSGECSGRCGTGTCRSASRGNRGRGWHVDASYLLMCPRNADVAFAVPTDGPVIGVPIQTGRIGVLNPDYQGGFAVGLRAPRGACAGIDVDYRYFDSSTADQIRTDAPRVVRSLVSHPSTLDAAADFLAGGASLDINFQTVDLVYRRTLASHPRFCTDYVLGARYGHLQQEFAANFVDGGRESVTTDLGFDGAGLRLGLEALSYCPRPQLHAYVRGHASFLAGRFQGEYSQGDSFDPDIVRANWEAGRVVPVLDLELGVGWTSPGNGWLVRLGYAVSAWYNTVTTQEFVRAVQANNLVDLGNTLTFDGLVARVEYRF
jgi:hypothetical protein